MKNAKKLLLYLPYVVFALLGTKLGQAHDQYMVAT